MREFLWWSLGQFLQSLYVCQLLRRNTERSCDGLCDRFWERSFDGFVTASGNVLATAFAIASENIHTSVPRVNGVMALVMVPGMVRSIAKLGFSIR